MPTNIDISRLANEALKNSEADIFPTDFISTNFGGVGKLGDTIKVDVLGESAGVAVYNATTNNYEKDREISEAFVSVTPTNPYLDGFSMDATSFKAISEDGFRKRFNRHVRELIRTMLVDTMGICTEANYSNQEIIGASSAFDKTIVTQIRTNSAFEKFGLENMSNI